MQTKDQGYWRGFGKLVWSKIKFPKSTNQFLANNIVRRTIISKKVTLITILELCMNYFVS